MIFHALCKTWAKASCHRIHIISLWGCTPPLGQISFTFTQFLTNFLPNNRFLPHSQRLLPLLRNPGFASGLFPRLNCEESWLSIMLKINSIINNWNFFVWWQNEEAVHLPVLWTSLHQVVQPADPRENAHRRASLLVRHLWESVQTPGPSQGPQVSKQQHSRFFIIIQSWQCWKVSE